jgi:hypothetical protein
MASRRSQHYLEAGELGEYLLATLWHQLDQPQVSPLVELPELEMLLVQDGNEVRKADWYRSPEAMEEDIGRHIFLLFKKKSVRYANHALFGQCI